MESWEKEAKFVLDVNRKDNELFSIDHVKQNKSEEFASEWGFSYDEIWDLDKTIAMFLLPRIAYFRFKNDTVPNQLIKYDEDGYTPLNEKEVVKHWNDILETICDGLHLYIEKDSNSFSEKEKELWNNAKKYLSGYFECLWS